MKKMLSNAIIRFRARFSVRAALDRAWISEIIALGLACGSLFIDRRRRLAMMVSAARRSEYAMSRALLRRVLAPWLSDPDKRCAWRESQIGWKRYYGEAANVANISDDSALTTSLVLKAPGLAGEKGVLYSSFEFNWLRLLANHDARALLRDYLLVGASSWSPGDHAVMASMQGLSDDPMFVGISNLADVDHYRLWSPGGGTVPLPITAADWTDPASFQPRPHQKRDVDIVMVSHFAKWKRHWLLFEALQRLPASLRVVLIGRKAADGRTEVDILREARAFGVRQHLEIYKNIEFDQVAAHQCNAKVAIALSRREGSCVSVTEAMFADTPVVMMDDAHVGAVAYVNDTTGRVTSRKALAATVMDVIEDSAGFAPRAWALKNISASATSAKLNKILRDYCVGRGKPWTRDVAPMCWRYVPQYLNRADEQRLAPAVERLRRDHGVVLARFAGERPGGRREEAPGQPVRVSA